MPITMPAMGPGLIPVFDWLVVVVLEEANPLLIGLAMMELVVVVV